jgi:hypothetical protein
MNAQSFERREHLRYCDSARLRLADLSRSGEMRKTGERFGARSQGCL